MGFYLTLQIKKQCLYDHTALQLCCQDRKTICTLASQLLTIFVVMITVHLVIRRQGTKCFELVTMAEKLYNQNVKTESMASQMIICSRNNTVSNLRIHYSNDLFVFSRRIQHPASSLDNSSISNKRRLDTF